MVSRAMRGCLAAVALTASLSAVAAPPEHEGAVTAPEAPLPPGQAPRHRPDYGRPPEPSRWSEHLLWIPRALLAPLYVASDLVSKPIAALVIIAEKYRWRARVHDLLTFGESRQVGVFPTGRIDTGFDPSVGLYIFWNDVWRASDVRAQVMTGGSAWWKADADWRIPFGSETLALTFAFSKRPDSAFHGLGKASSPEAARFDEQRLETRLSYRLPLAPGLGFTTRMGQQWLVFGADGTSPQATSVAEAIEAGRFSAPPALAGGVLALDAALRLDFDSRAGRFTPSPRTASDYALMSGTGVAATAVVEQHSGLRRTRAAPEQPARFPAWLSYGARVVGTLDVTGSQRRVDLELYAAFTQPLPHAGDVPFTEQVSLGGSRPLRGFGGRRLLDRSGAAATLRYRWPIWSALDGVLHYAAGNVFGPSLRGFALRDLRASFGAGITTVPGTQQSFELLIAFGTEALGAGGAVESTRLTAGTGVSF